MLADFFARLFARRDLGRRRAKGRKARPRLELLEARELLNADFGDAPDPTYPTVLASNGARHVLVANGPQLGTSVSADADGQPSAGADGDAGDDGVKFPVSLLATAGQATTGSVVVTVTGAAGKLDGWLDFDGNGAWDSSERIADGLALGVGTRLVRFTVPAGARPGDTFARFRLSTAGGLASTGEATDGEVEDYAVTLLDGDTPAGVPVRLQLPTGGAYGVTFQGGAVFFTAPDGDDLFRAPVASVASVRVDSSAGNDDVRVNLLSGFPAGRVVTVFVDADRPDDVTVYGSTDDDTAVLTPNAAKLTADRYRLDVAGAGKIVVHAGGGANAATLYDTPGNDEAVLTPNYAIVENAGRNVFNQVIGFERVVAVSTNGGSDVARLFDTVGNDKVVLTANYVYVANSALKVHNQASYFAKALVYGNAGGRDRAFFYDTPGNDRVVMTERYTYLRSGNGRVHNQVGRGFEEVYVRAVNGGRDVAYLYDTAGNDLLVPTPAYAYLRNQAAGLYLQAAGFDVVVAYATAGGTDTVWGYGSAAADQLIVTARYGILRSFGRYYHQFNGFEQTTINAYQGGIDVAYLYGSARSDLYTGSGSYGRLADDLGAWGVTVLGFRAVRLYGGQGVDIANVASLSYGLAHPGFVTPQSLLSAGRPGDRAQALASLKALALRFDPRLARAGSSLQLAIWLRDHVHRRIVLGANTQAWTQHDPYTRYLTAVAFRSEAVLCGGMVMLYRDLLEAFGLTSRQVGLFLASGRDSHATVEVAIGGSWVAMDPTFNVSFVTRGGHYLNYAQLQAGVPYLVSRNGMTSRPNLILERYYLPLRSLLYRITYTA